MANLIRENPSVEQQKLLFDALRFEPLLWLGVVAAGFAAVSLCELFLRKEVKSSAAGEPKGKPWKSTREAYFWEAAIEKIVSMRDKMQQSRAAKGVDSRKTKGPQYLNAVLAVFVSVVIAQFCIGIFAQDRAAVDRQIGLVAAQPAIGQIVFGVWISFGIAAFVARKFLRVGYIWPTIASGLVTAFGIVTYMKQDTVAYLVEHWPAVFYSNGIMSILPIQMVAFGALGSIWGYWLAVRFAYWREHSRTE